MDGDAHGQPVEEADRPPRVRRRGAAGGSSLFAGRPVGGIVLEPGAQRPRDLAEGTAFRVRQSRRSLAAPGPRLGPMLRRTHLLAGPDRRPRPRQGRRDAFADVGEPGAVAGRFGFGFRCATGASSIATARLRAGRLFGTGGNRLVGGTAVRRRGACPGGLRAQEAEAAEADQFPLRPVDRHPGPIHRHLEIGAVDAPEERAAAEGLAPREEIGDPARIPHHGGRQVGKGPADNAAGRGPDHLLEGRRDMGEAAIRIRLPDETHGAVPAKGRARMLRRRRGRLVA